MLNPIIVAAPFALLAIYLAWRFWPRTGKALYDHHHAMLSHDMRSRNLTEQQQHEEMTFRHTLARVRRRASDAAKMSPNRWRERLSEIVAEETKLLAHYNRSLARRVADVIRKAPTSDILYPDALKAVDRCDGCPGHHPTEDHIASVRTIR